MNRARLIKREDLVKEEKKEMMQQASMTTTASPSLTFEEVRKWIQERQRKSAPDARSAFSALFAQS
jgi:hypothetical protein